MDVNRAVFETKIGFFRRVTHDMVNAGTLTTKNTRDCWAEGVLDAESWSILPSLQSYQAFNRLEINQLDKNMSEFC